VDPALAAVAAAVPAEQTRTAHSAESGTESTTAASGTAKTVTTTAVSSKSSSVTASGSARHARPTGNWDSVGWQEALERASAAQRSVGQGNTGGRHRADSGGGFTRP
jgi:hypothetical protein